jgi:MFS family permease
VSAVRAAAGRTFQSLRVRNYRLYFTGQVISVSGTWMQTVAQAYLVLSVLHGNGVAIGVTTALQFVPMLFLASWGGLVADRVDKRRLLLVTQGAAAVLALSLGVLTLTKVVELWQVYLLAGLLGVVNLFDNPARQSFVSEMVPRELLPNAVSLNSVVMNSARVIGPAIGGVLIFTVGVADCFFVNAASYVAVIVALALMVPAELLRSPRVARAKGQVREGFRYVWSTPGLRDPLLLMAVVGIFAFNFTTTLPLLAHFTYHGGAGVYAAMSAAMGTGAVIGGLLVAHRARPSVRLLTVIGLAFGVMIMVVALVPSVALTLAALVPMGACSIAFIATSNATLQLTSEPSMRGRVMALYATAFLGTTPIGAPIVGAVSDAFSPRVALGLGAVATLVASVLLAWRYLGLPVRRPRIALSVDDGGPGVTGSATT